MSEGEVKIKKPHYTLGHLQSVEEIAEVFRVSRATVTGWKNNGAPIHQVGKNYQAQYTELWGWLVLETARKGKKEDDPENMSTYHTDTRPTPDRVI